MLPRDRSGPRREEDAGLTRRAIAPDLPSPHGGYRALGFSIPHSLGILTNIVLGIVGAALANFLLGIFGVALGGWLGYLIAGFIGACILIFAWRAIKGRT
jgi:uncharacterized membrane protein YeaQ/YmgE (transglycosylase-associated protein family)